MKLCMVVPHINTMLQTKVVTLDQRSRSQVTFSSLKSFPPISLLFMVRSGLNLAWLFSVLRQSVEYKNCDFGSKVKVTDNVSFKISLAP